MIHLKPSVLLELAPFTFLNNVYRQARTYLLVTTRNSGVLIPDSGNGPSSVRSELLSSDSVHL